MYLHCATNTGESSQLEKAWFMIIVQPLCYMFDTDLALQMNPTSIPLITARKRNLRRGGRAASGFLPPRGSASGGSVSGLVCIQDPGGASASGGYMGYYGIRSTSGWYTFYWNALLFTVMFYVVDSSSSDSPHTAEPTSSTQAPDQTVIGTM